MRKHFKMVKSFTNQLENVLPKHSPEILYQKFILKFIISFQVTPTKYFPVQSQ